MSRSISASSTSLRTQAHMRVRTPRYDQARTERAPARFVHAHARKHARFDSCRMTRTVAEPPKLQQQPAGVASCGCGEGAVLVAQRSGSIEQRARAPHRVSWMVNAIEWQRIVPTRTHIPSTAT
jgi:hypothetical protein